MSPYYRWYSNFKPAGSYEAYCGYEGDCAFKPHPDNYLEDTSQLPCFLGYYFDSVCPPNERTDKPLNTFRIIVWVRYDNITVQCSDDDDTYHEWMRKFTPELLENITRWLNQLLIIDLGAIDSRLSSWNRIM